SDAARAGPARRAPATRLLLRAGPPTRRSGSLLPQVPRARARGRARRPRPGAPGGAPGAVRCRPLSCRVAAYATADQARADAQRGLRTGTPHSVAGQPAWWPAAFALVAGAAGGRWAPQATRAGVWGRAPRKLESVLQTELDLARLRGARDA